MRAPAGGNTGILRLMARQWSRARLDDIGTSRSPEWWQEWATDQDYGRRWREVREHFGITAFGVNAYEAEAGKELVVRHEESSYGGQEELYLLVRGRARFRLDDDEVEIAEGELLYVPADVVRDATALATPTIIFMVGGSPGAYEPFDWDALDAGKS